VYRIVKLFCIHSYSSVDIEYNSLTFNSIILLILNALSNLNLKSISFTVLSNIAICNAFYCFMKTHFKYLSTITSFIDFSIIVIISEKSKIVFTKNYFCIHLLHNKQMKAIFLLNFYFIKNFH
jgi:hypothetical protein